VNISSDAGRKPFGGLCVYSATKHYVEAWAHVLREELAPKNIKVLAVK
jgi:short-subunit dehydrogenase